MTDTINNVKNTFSSWDSCMSKTYCKWPVIAGIIIGSLILLSVLFCIGRCLCCGAECACCCFRCCAGCCGGGRRRDKGHEHIPSVPSTPYGGPPGGELPMYNNQQYRSAPAPVYHQNNNSFAQTATFDGKVHEDSLPVMPSWETAATRKVEVVEEVKSTPGAGEAHEMEKLSPTGQAMPTTVPGIGAPLAARTVGSAPHSPYAADERDPFLQGQQTNGVMHAGGYRGASPAPAVGQIGYGYANQRPGYQNSQSFNSRDGYQESQSDFYAQSGQGAAPAYGDQRPDGYDRQYSNQNRPAYDDRQYSEQQGAGYDRQFNEQPRHDGGGYQHHPVLPVYDNQPYGHEHQPGGYDSHQGAYRAFSPAHGGAQGRKAVNGSWRDV